MNLAKKILSLDGDIPQLTALITVVLGLSYLGNAMPSSQPFIICFAVVGLLFLILKPKSELRLKEEVTREIYKKINIDPAIDVELGLLMEQQNSLLAQLNVPQLPLEVKQTKLDLLNVCLERSNELLDQKWDAMNRAGLL